MTCKHGSIGACPECDPSAEEIKNAEQAQSLGLTEEEDIILKWRFGRFGSFYMALMDAILKADPTNRAQLAKAFPVHVNAVERYGNEPGWFSGVLRRASTNGYPLAEV